MKKEKLTIRADYYPSNAGCGPCSVWHGAIDVAEAKIKDEKGKDVFALYYGENCFVLEVTYSINKKSYFDGNKDSGTIESYDRLSDAKSSSYYSVFRQLLDEVKKNRAARKGTK